MIQAIISISDVTALLRAASQGDTDAEDRLFALLYADLQRLARAQLAAGRRPGDSLDTAALVHEAYLRLAGTAELEVVSRAHFFNLVVRVMRHVLIDFARRRDAEKRGAALRVSWPEGMDLAASAEASETELLALDAALARLREESPRLAQVVELRFYAGLALEERVLLLGHQQSAADGPLREALSIYGPDRFEGAHCLRYLGLSAMNQGRHQEAADLFARAAATYASTLGLGDVQHWRALANLGWAHLRLGRIGLAHRELATAVTHIERLTGPESYELRLPLKQLGEALTGAGAHDEALATLERVRRLEEKLFGTTRHREVAGSDLLLARARIARGAPGDRAAARRLLEEALAIFSGLPHDHDALYFDVLTESRRLAGH